MDEVYSGVFRFAGQQAKTIYENAQIDIKDKIQYFIGELKNRGVSFGPKTVDSYLDLDRYISKTFYGITGSHEIIALGLIFINFYHIIGISELNSDLFTMEKISPYYFCYYLSKKTDEEAELNESYNKFVNFSISFIETIENLSRIIRHRLYSSE